jgi:hypothetical protein
MARYRTLMSTRLVTYTGPQKVVAERGVRNMYGCLPCPRCGSGYRASYEDVWQGSACRVWRRVRAV